MALSAGEGTVVSVQHVIRNDLDVPLSHTASWVSTGPRAAVQARVGSQGSGGRDGPDV